MRLHVTRAARTAVIAEPAVDIRRDTRVETSIAATEQIGAPVRSYAHAAMTLSSALRTLPASSLRKNGFCKNETSGASAPFSGMPLA